MSHAFVRSDLFGGTGEVHITDLLRGVARPPFTAALACSLAPSGHVGAHRQENCPEIVIGLDGEGQATVDGVPQPLGAGELVYLPLGSVLTITNHRDDAPLRYLIVKAR